MNSLGQKSSKKFKFEETADSADLKPDTQTFDLLQSAADILNESSNSTNTTFQFDAELIDIEENNNKNCFFIETSTPTDFLLNEEIKFNFNDYVSINNKKRGVIKYIGRVHFTNGLFFGIELDEAEGRHDGQIDNIRYFQCKQNHGIFAPFEKIKLVNLQDINRRSLTKPDQLSLSSSTSSSSSSLELIKSIIDNNNKYTFRPIKSVDNLTTNENKTIRNNDFKKQAKTLNKKSSNKMLTNNRLTLASLHKTNSVTHPNESQANVNTLLNSKSTSSTGSTLSSTSTSSSSSSNTMHSLPISMSNSPPSVSATNSLSRLNFQLKLNKFNHKPASNIESPTSTITTSSIPNSTSKLGAFNVNKPINNNATIITNDNSTSSQQQADQAQKKLSKLKPPSNLAKYSPQISTTATTAQSVCVLNRNSMQTNANQTSNLDIQTNETNTQITTNTSAALNANATAQQLIFKQNNLINLPRTNSLNKQTQIADHVTTNITKTNSTNGDISKLKSNLIKYNLKLNDTNNIVNTNLASSTSSSSSSVNIIPTTGKKSPNTSPIRRSAPQTLSSKTKMITSANNAANNTSLKSSAIPSLASVRSSFHNNDTRRSLGTTNLNSISTGCTVLSNSTTNSNAIQSLTNQHNLTTLTTTNQQTKNESLNNKSVSLIKTKVFQPTKVQSIPAFVSTANTLTSANKIDEINSNINNKKQTKQNSLKPVASITPASTNTSTTNSMTSIQQQSTKSTTTTLSSNQIRNINNQMNETFDVGDELPEDETVRTKVERTNNQETINSLLNFIDIQKSKNLTKKQEEVQLKQTKPIFDDIEEEERRRSILLIENNFDFSAGISSSSSSSVVASGHGEKQKSTNKLTDDDDDFLENELIPDDLLDEMHSFIESIQEKQEFLNEINLLNTQTIVLNKKTVKENNNNNNVFEKTIELQIKEPQITMTTNHSDDLTHLNNTNDVSLIDNDVEQVLDNLIEKLCQTNDVCVRKLHVSETNNVHHMMKDKTSFVLSNDKQSALNQNADDYDAIKIENQKIETEIGEQEELIAAVVESETELELVQEEEHLMNKTFDLNETIDALTQIDSEDIILIKNNNSSQNNLDLNQDTESLSDMQNKTATKLPLNSQDKQKTIDKNRIPTKIGTATAQAQPTKRLSVVNTNNAAKTKKPTVTQSNNENKTIINNKTITSIANENSNVKKSIPNIEQSAGQASGPAASLLTAANSSTIVKNQRKLTQKSVNKTNKLIDSVLVASNPTNISNKEDDLNSVFEADNQTTCSSDNDESSKSSTKSLSAKPDAVKLVSSTSKTRGRRINSIINELNTVVTTSNTATPTASSPITVANVATKSSNSMNTVNTVTPIPNPSNSILATPTASVNASAISTSNSPTTDNLTNTNNNNNTTFNSSVNSTSSKLNKPNYSLSSSTTTVKKQHSNNKENQQGKMPKSLALNKIYKSRDGLAAVSSNTSIMSELSNISKSSLPSSIPTSSFIRQTSVSSSASSNKQQSTTNSKQLSQTPLLLQPKQFQEQQKHLVSSSSTKLLTQTSKQQLQQLSSNSRTHLGAFALSNHTFNSENARKASTTNTLPSSGHLADSIKNSIKKPGHSIQTPSLSKGNEINTALSVNTAGNQTASSSTSPSNSLSSIKMNKNELKLNKEIKRLEALCESRTKELTLLKLKLRDTLISFDAIAVALNYLSNDLNGFEVTDLRSKLSIAKRQHNELVKTLKMEIVDKETRLKTLQTELETLTVQSDETKLRLEKELKDILEEHKTQLDLDRKEHNLIVETLKQEKESSIKRLNKTIETMKIDNEKIVFDLNEQLKSKQTENIDLTNRIKECEETLAKDKDERIQRLLDSQRTLEKEIESLKTALDIKNLDLFDLRTKNNELTTKLEGFNELNIKCRRYKQELEQANAILANKQEAEKQASENNRMLAMKIEVKNRENQRLSMQNEQLQFRLQSHPNLSINGDNSFNMSSISINPYDEQHDQSSSKCKRASTMREPSYLNNDSCTDNLNSTDQVEASNTSPTPPVKLRSKSFKTQQSNIEHSSKKNYSNYRPNHQYRPVSEMYDMNISDRDTLMTRSYTTTSSSGRHHNNNINNIVDNNEDNLDNTIDISNDANSARCVSSSSSSSISHLDSNSQVEDQMTKSCTVLKSNDNESGEKLQEENLIINQDNSNKIFFNKNNNDNSLSSSSSVSINEHSVIILD